MQEFPVTAKAYPEGFTYVGDFLADDAQRDLRAMLPLLTFTRDKFRGQWLKRRYAQFGHAYVSIGRKLAPAPAFPDFLVALRDKVLRLCPEGTRLDQCIVTHYPDGAGI